ncbi:MAG: hypothetical protein GY926_09250 [bacterium]|nr:hypothetical protein [bacterium]
MFRLSRRSVVGFWVAVFVFGSVVAAVAHEPDSAAAVQTQGPAGTSDLLGEARSSWDLEHIDFDTQAAYQYDFRKQYDFLSEDPTHVASTLTHRPDGKTNRSVEELGLILTDDEWSEFERRAELASRAGDIRTALSGRALVSEEEPRFGSQYGGIWQDHSAGGVLRLYVTDLAAANVAALLDIVPRGEADLVVSEVAFSFDELWDFHARVGAVLAERGIVGEAATIDLATNAVLVRSNEAFKIDGVPSDAVRFEDVSPGAGDFAEVAGPGYTHTTSNLQSGLEIRVWDLTRHPAFDLRCTWGFTGHTSSYNYLVTAGHCVAKAGSQDYWTGYTDWQQDGEAATGVWRGDNRFTVASHTARYDAARIMSSYADTNCYHQYTDCGTTIQKRLSLYGHMPGQTVCASLGKSNTYRCGLVIDWPFTGVLPGGDFVENRVGAGMLAISGDSGAGLKYATIAHGILAESNQSDIVYFVPAYYVKSKLGFDFNCVRSGSHWAACPITQ